MKKILCVLPGIFLFGIIFISSLAAADRFVSPWGVDYSTNGTSSHPWRSLKYAVDNSDDGDVIKISSGTYISTGTVISARVLTICGGYESSGWTLDYDLYKTTVTNSLGSETTVLTVSNSSVTLEGLSITGGYYSGIELNGSTAVITDCDIHHNDGSVFASGIKLISYSGTVATVRNCLIRNNLKNGIANWQECCLTAINNVIINNGDGGVDAGIYNRADAANLNVRNNIIVNNNGYNVWTSPFFTGYYNNTWGSPSGNYNYVNTNGISQDPLFVSTVTGNFQLQPGSPCIDKGDVHIKDLDSTRSDMGLYDGKGGSNYVIYVPAWFDTLTSAISNSYAGDEIKIASGTYTEALVMPSGGSLKLEGGWNHAFDSRDLTSYETVIDDNGNYRLEMRDLDGAVYEFDGLKLTGANKGAYNDITGGTLTFRNCTFNTSGTGIEITAIGTDVAIDGCRFTGTGISLDNTGARHVVSNSYFTGAGMSLGDGAIDVTSCTVREGSISTVTGADVNISSCVIYFSAGSGIYINPGNTVDIYSSLIHSCGNAAIYYEGSGDIIGNTVDRGTSTVWDLTGIYINEGSPVIKNNIVTNFWYGVELVLGQDPNLFAYNVLDNLTNLVDPDEPLVTKVTEAEVNSLDYSHSNIVSNPLYVSTASFNYHLQSNSVAIDAADPSSPVNDEPAPNGSRKNCGFYGGSSDAAASETTPPAAVTNLTALAGENNGEIILQWTAPGDDGTSGRNIYGSNYIVKYATYAVGASSSAWWNGAAEFVQDWEVDPVGTQSSEVVDGLEPGKRYYFALMTRDNSNNYSAIDTRAASGATQANNTAKDNSNDVPSLGYAAADILSTGTMRSDGSKYADIDFRVKDLDVATDTASFVSGSAQYRIDGGAWLDINDGSVVFSSSVFVPAADWSGEVYTMSWKTDDQMGNVDNGEVEVRFRVTDGTAESQYAVTQGTFTVDNYASQIWSFAAVAALSDGIKYKWSSSDAHFDHYEIWYSTMSGITRERDIDHEWDNDDDPTMAFASSTYTVITGLLPLTTYYAKIWKIDSYGNEGYQALLASTVTLALPPPAAPAGFSGTVLSTASIMWEWNDVSSEDGYEIRSSTGFVLVSSGTLTADTTQWIQTELSANTSSYVRKVYAVNGGGYSDASADPPGFPVFTLARPPSGIYLSDVSSFSVTVNWEQNDNPDYTRWGVLRSTDGFQTSNEVLKNFADNYTDTTYIDGGLSADAYWYKVLAYNEDGVDSEPAGPVIFQKPIFSLETVDAADGQYSSLAIDREGNMHVAYSAAGQLRYGKYEGGSWSLETINSENPSYTSLAVAPDGGIHIFYRSGGSLRWARRNGLSWDVSNVESGQTYANISAAADAAGAIHVSYYETSNDYLKYARYNGQSWSIETLDSGGDVGQYSSLALDSAGRPRIAYQDNTNSALKYASFDGIEWSTAVVDGSGRPYHISMALNGSGLPRIAYMRSGLKYAHYDGSDWTVDSTPLNSPYYTSLSLDGEGMPHVSFYAIVAGNYEIVYSSFNGVSWSSVSIDTFTLMGYGTSLVLDESGLPHITYDDDDNSDLIAVHFEGEEAPAPMGGNPRSMVQQPTGMSGSALGISSITWCWTNNASNEMGYRLYCSSAGSSGFSMIADTVTLAAGSVSFIQESLSVNTSYQAYVAAVNPGGSVTSFSTKCFTMAEVPANVVVLSVTQDNVILNWGSNGNPEPGTDYEVWRATESGFTSPTVIEVSTSGANITDLFQDTTYYFDVRAVNGGGLPSGFVGYVSTRTLASPDVTPPGKVTDLSASPREDNRILLTWTAPGDDDYSGALPAGSEYRIQYSTDDPASVSWSTAAAQVVISTFGVLPGVNVSTTVTVSQDFIKYTFRIWTKDEKPENWSVQSGTAGVISNPFVHEVLDGSASGSGSIAVDYEGNLHVAYLDTGGLSYIKRTGAAWSPPEVVDPVSASGQIAVDSEANPHVLYYDSDNEILKYASKNGVAWSTFTIETVSGTGDAKSLAMDAGGRPHVSYRYFVSPVDKGIKYAFYYGTAWDITIIDSDSSPIGCAMGLEASGLPHIVYEDRCASFDGDSWSIEYAVPVYEDASLVIDSQGNLHVSSYDQWIGLGSLQYGSRINGSWSDEKIDPPTGGISEGYGADSSIALDGAGRPHIAYRNETTYKLKYARYDGAEWALNEIGTDGESVLTVPSMALDGTGAAHVLSFDTDTSDLRYSCWNGAAPSGPIGGNPRSRAQAPSALDYDIISSNQVQYSWTNNASNELGFRLYGALCSTVPFTIIADTVAIGEDAISYIESGLVKNTTYYRYIVAVNAGGIAFSNMVSFIISDPATPQNFSGTALSSATVKWAWLNVEDEDGYEIRSSTGFVLVSSGTLTADTTGWIQTGLSANASSYVLKVYAVNGSGYSDASADPPGFPVFTFARPPSGIYISDVSSVSVTVNWSRNGDPTYTKWGILRSTDGFQTSTTTLKDFADSYTDITYADTALESSTTYWYKVFAYNENGVKTDYDETVSTKTLIGPPDAPADFSGTALSSAAVRWTWTDVENEDGYRVRSSTGGELKTLGNNITECEEKGLSVNSPYARCVEAYNAFGASSSTLKTVYTLAEAPSAAMLENVWISSVTLSWSRGSNPGWTRFGVSFSTDNYLTHVSTFLAYPDSHTSETVEVAGLSARTTYWFRIWAYNGNEFESDYISISTVTVAAAIVEYMASGYIKDNNNEGVSGVAVHSSGGKTVATGSDGYYSITLAQGAYVLTPSRDGWVFSPEARNVTLSADSSENNFTAVAKNVSIVTVSSGKTISIDPNPGRIDVEFPANTFAEDVQVTVTVPDDVEPVPAIQPDLKSPEKAVAVEIFNNKSLQPGRKVKVAICYRDSDAAGMNEEFFIIGRYDDTRKAWLPVESTVYPSDNKVVGFIDHFSVYRILQFIPLDDLKAAKVYPNPFYASRHGKITFGMLTAGAGVKIFTLSGEYITELKDDNSDGRIEWEGNDLVSGVYLCLVSGGKQHKTLRLIIVR